MGKVEKRRRVTECGMCISTLCPPYIFPSIFECWSSIGCALIRFDSIRLVGFGVSQNESNGIDGDSE